MITKDQAQIGTRVIVLPTLEPNKLVHITGSVRLIKLPAPARIKYVFDNFNNDFGLEVAFDSGGLAYVTPKEACLHTLFDELASLVDHVED